MTKASAGPGRREVAVRAAAVPLAPGSIDRMISADGWELVAAGLADRTRETYAYWWERVRAWCVATGRQYDPMPIPTLITYMGHLEKVVGPDGRPTSPSTVGIVLATVRYVHMVRRDREPDYPVPQSKALTMAFVGYCRRWAAAGHRVRRATPTTWEDLARFRSALDTDHLRDQRNLVIVLCGFFGAMRGAELAALRVEDVTVNRGGMSLYLAHSKTDQKGKGAWVTMQRYGHADLCPVRAMEAWLATLAGAGITRGPLLRVMHGRGRDLLRPEAVGMGSKAISKVTETLAAAVGLEGVWGAHSHRRGAATEAARAGCPVQEIMRLGRWKTAESALRYIDEAVYSNPLIMLGPGAGLEAS